MSIDYIVVFLLALTIAVYTGYGILQILKSRSSAQDSHKQRRA
jgi:hypothetical protein